MEGYGTKALTGIRPGGAEVIIVLLPGATIRGTVTDRESGEPLEGAHVTAGPSAGVTDPSGRFTLTDVDAGTITMRAMMETYVPAEREVAVDAGASLEGIAIVLAQGSGILGTVLDPKGTPLPGARVRAYAGFLTTKQGTTDSRGRFALGGLGEGVYTVDARSGDFAPAVRTDIRLEEGQRITGIELRLRLGGAVEGEIRSASGAPIGGASVRVEPSEETAGPVEDAFTRLFEGGERTDAKGAYRIGGLTEGAFRVKVLADGHLPATSAEFRVVEGETARMDLTLEVGLVIVGRVVSRAGRPVAEATVEQAQDMMQVMMTGMRQERPSTRTKPDGSFVLAGLKGGAVDISASADGYASHTLKEVRPGEGEVEFVLGNLGSIAGRVLNDKPRMPLESFRAEAMPTTSMFPGMAGFQPAGSVTNLGDGYFRISGLEPGSYNLSVYSDDHAPGRKPSVQVNEGQETGGLEILLVRGEKLQGVVVADATGRPVSGVAVSADISGNMLLGMVGMGERRDTTTDEEGRFSLAGLPRGTTTVRASHPDFAPHQLPNLRVPPEAPLEIRLSGGGTVIVRVLTIDGEPRVGSMVILQRNMPFSQQIGTTDDKGEVRFDNIPAGSYMAMEMNLGGLARRGLAGMDMKFKTAAVEDGKIVEVELQSAGGSTVRGRVMRGDTGVDGALVYLMSGTQTFEAIEGMKFGATDENGNYEIKDVPPGEYSIMIARQMGAAPTHSEKIVVEEGRDARKDMNLPLAAVSGHVVDESGKGVAGAQVAAVPGQLADFRTGDIDDAMSAYGHMVSSEADGSFTLDGLKPGTYVIRAWREGLASVYSEPFRVPELGSGPDDLTITLPLGIEVTVKVRKPGGEPLAGAWIFATDSEGRTISLTIQIASQTDTQGVAVLRLAPGGYRVEVQAIGHPAAFREFQVGQGSGTTVTVDVPVGGRLDVTVQGADGVAVPDVQVDLLDEEGRSVGRRVTQDFALDSGDLTRTDEEGKLPFPLLAPGTYRLRATADDGRKAEGSVTVTSGGSHELTLVLR
jgi:protocatechuate 3,4-dioxygenase beta subunit